jgi:hypothetical protein
LHGLVPYPTDESANKAGEEGGGLGLGGETVDFGEDDSDGTVVEELVEVENVRTAKEEGEMRRRTTTPHAVPIHRAQRATIGSVKRKRSGREEEILTASKTL